MEFQSFGCLPIVRRAGGLAGTVSDGENGFSFDAMTKEALLHAVDRALRTRESDSGSAVLHCALTQNNG